MQPRSSVCGIKKSRFVTEQKAKGLLSNLGLKTSLHKIPLLGDMVYFVKCIKMNKIVNKFLLAGDKFMSLNAFKTAWLYLQRLWSIHKNKEKIEKFTNTGNTDFIYRNHLHKACFQHDVAYVKSKGLARRLSQIKF